MQLKKVRMNMSGRKKYLQITGRIFLGAMLSFLLIILSLRWIEPPFTAFTLQENWLELGKERYSLREQWLTADEIPDHLELAVIASEDQRFYSHWGLDLTAIDKAIAEKEQRGRLRGASTITQQVAKNLFLSPARSYFRKGLEAGIAVLIEWMWPKERILEVYLNTAEFGPGMFGVNTASWFYYSKSASQLNPEEAAKMATVLPNPKIIEPVPASDYVRDRSQWILRNMEQLSGLHFLPKPEPEAEIPPFTLDSLPIPFQKDTVPDVQINGSNMSTNKDSLSAF